jgi:hypothetical protein
LRIYEAGLAKLMIPIAMPLTPRVAISSLCVTPLPKSMANPLHFT